MNYKGGKVLNNSEDAKGIEEFAEREESEIMAGIGEVVEAALESNINLNKLATRIQRAAKSHQ